MIVPEVPYCAHCGFPVTRDPIPHGYDENKNPKYYHVGCLLREVKDEEADK